MGSDLEIVDRPLALEVQKAAGIYALGAQTDDEFGESLTRLKRGLERLDIIIATVLVEGTDYDTPSYAGTYVDKDGTEHKKKNLRLPGAEKLALMARLVPSFDFQRLVGDGDTVPDIVYVVKCRLHMGSHDGPVVAEGLGSANTFETKYRYRYAEKSCPACGAVGSIRKSQFPPRGAEKGTPPGWWCKECKADFVKDDESITLQGAGKVDNPDPLDLDNTVLKMAKTRGFRDAVKMATGGSARLEQDMEDLPAGNAQPKAAESGQTVAQSPARAELVDRLFILAKDRGVTKFGDMFDHIRATNGILAGRMTTVIRDFSDNEIRSAVEAWEKK